MPRMSFVYIPSFIVPKYSSMMPESFMSVDSIDSISDSSTSPTDSEKLENASLNESSSIEPSDSTSGELTSSIKSAPSTHHLLNLPQS